MKGIGKSVSCDNCDHPLQDYHGASHPGEITCDSSLYGAYDVVLCKRCSHAEEIAIDDAGTNDIPELARQYSVRKNIHEYEGSHIVE